jgi:hypothetical protein
MMKIALTSQNLLCFAWFVGVVVKREVVVSSEKQEGCKGEEKKGEGLDFKMAPEGMTAI